MPVKWGLGVCHFWWWDLIVCSGNHLTKSIRPSPTVSAGSLDDGLVVKSSFLEKPIYKELVVWQGPTEWQQPQPHLSEQPGMNRIGAHNDIWSTNPPTRCTTRWPSGRGLWSVLVFPLYFETCTSALTWISKLNGVWLRWLPECRSRVWVTPEVLLKLFLVALYLDCSNVLLATSLILSTINLWSSKSVSHVLCPY